MTGYELSKDWFDWAFENPDLNSPTTTALYMWVIEKWNRMSQKPKFGFPASEAMEAIGVKSYNTYKKSLSQLVELGAIVMVQESKNQYTANIIAVSKFNKAHTKALSKHLLKQSESTSESSSSIDKPLTSNLEPETNTPQPPVATPKPEKEPIKVHPLQTYIKEHCPRVSKLSKQLTYEEAEAIVKEFDRTLIKTKLEAMENKKKLDYVSVNLTLRNWLKNGDFSGASDGKQSGPVKHGSITFNNV